MYKIITIMILIAGGFLSGCATNLTAKVDPVPELEVDLVEKAFGGSQPSFSEGISVYVNQYKGPYTEPMAKKLEGRLEERGLILAKTPESADYVIRLTTAGLVSKSSMVGATSADGATVGAGIAKALGRGIPIVGAAASLTFGTIALIDHFNGKAKEVNNYQLFIEATVTPRGAEKISFVTAANMEATRNHLKKKDAAEVLTSLGADFCLQRIFPEPLEDEDQEDEISADTEAEQAVTAAQ